MDESNLGLLFIGDVFFTEEDSVLFFKKVKKELKDYVVLANLEGSIDFSMGSYTKKAVRLALPVFKKEDIPENLIFSMVNNHVTDFGEANFKKNLEYFGDSAVVSTRSNVSNYICGNKIILMADKKEQCVLNGTDFISFSNKHVDIVGKEFSSSIVVIHGGIEHRRYPTHYQRTLARKIIEYGAKMVIFHHSHLVGHYEYWNGNLIHYGLGNAFFSNTLDLHSLEKSQSHGIVYDGEERILSLNQLDIVDDNVSNDGSDVDQLSNSDYVEFYKKLYRLDGSFRPRQLAINDFWTNIQFFVWSKIANFLVRWQLSKKIKIALNLFLSEKTKGHK